MRACVLIFHPGDHYIGLWRPDVPEVWVTYSHESAEREFNLYSAVLTLLRDQSLHVSSVTHIGVMAGPASYSQLRSYNAAANSIAWANQLPLFTISLTDCLPDSIPSLLATARTNWIVNPIYPTVIH